MAAKLAHGFQFGEFIAEPLRRCVTGDDMQPRHLPPKAMEVLVALADAAPEAVSREELIDRVWGERCVSEEVLTHAITELRHALGDSPSRPEYIQTIPKRGYRLFRVVRPLAPPGAARQAPVGQRRDAQGFAAVQRYPVVQGNGADMPGRVRALPDSSAASAHSQASELLLQAEYLERRATPGNNEQAEILLEKAVSIDPRNASAWSLLGRIYYRQTKLFRSRPLHEGSELARQAIQRSLAIDSNSGPAHAGLALVNMTFDFDFDAAFTHLREAQDISPSDPYVLRVAAKMEMTHGHVDHAIDLLERSARVDPQSCMGQSDLGRAYYFGHRLDDAERALEQSVLLNPDVIGTRYLLGIVRLARGKRESAIAAMREEPDQGFRTAGMALALHAMDDNAAFDEALEDSTRSTSEQRPYHVARVYAARGRRDEALDWLELAYDQREGDMVYLLVDPLLIGLRQEARWSLLVDKLGLPHRI
jgi:DNA-binding winged helix-turn-helix (wHTH) protein/Flp pilus assembly protein TadD